MSSDNAPGQRENRRPVRNGRGWGLILLPLAAVAAIAWRLKRPSTGAPLPNPWIPVVNPIDREIGWHRLPWPLGLGMVVALRRQLRRDNLHDPSTVIPSFPRAADPAPNHPRRARRTARSTTCRTPRWAAPARGSAATSRFDSNASESGAGDADAESAHRQPRAADPARVPARRRRSTCWRRPGSSS